MWAVLLLAFVAGAMAQIPTPCAGPNTFTGKFRHMDREQKFYREGKLYYDAVNKREREFEFEEIGSEKAAFDKLRLYNSNVEYTVDLKTRKCNVTVPRRSWRPHGVPPEARFRGSGVIGAVGVSSESVTVSMFEGEFEGRDPFFVTVTQPDCFVVEMGVFSNTTGFDHREYFDVVSGITDPDAFLIPEACLM